MGKEPLEFDLAPIIEALVELHKHSFERRALKLHVALGADLRVRADPDALAQVLGNLLQNAGRYTPDGGTVLVRASAESDSVLVSVAHSGGGISADHLPDLFERSYSVAKMREAAQGGA